MNIVDQIFKPVFNPILSPIMGIIDAMILLVKAIIIVLTAIPELLMTALQLFNPISIVNDAIVGSFMSIKIIITNIIGVITPKKKLYNKCSDTGGGLFGFRRAKNSEGKIIKNSKCANDKSCRRNYILKYLVVILCPPLAVFFHMGITGWYHVIVCTILTVYGYYFPGLIYALLHVMQFM